MELAGKIKEMVQSTGTPKSSILEEALKEDRTSLLLNFEINKVGQLVNLYLDSAAFTHGSSFFIYLFILNNAH